MPVPDNDCKLTYVNPQNACSHYLDLTIVYGDFVDAWLVRTNHSGLLKMSRGNVLPDAPCNGNSRCYFAGDSRVTQTFMLSMTHSMFFRLHNYIARVLANLHPTWDDQKLFYEARRINLAVYQHILYEEWIPQYLGPAESKKWKLTCNYKKGECGGFHEDIDPSASTEFAQSVFRFFHSHVPNWILTFDQNFKLVHNFTLYETFNVTPAYNLLENHYDDVLRCLLKQEIRLESLGYTPEMRNRVFPQNFRGGKVGVDLFFHDIMRSRDCGNAPFIDYYPPCLSTKIDSWDDLEPFFKPNNFKVLRKLYENVRDVELGVGILLENRTKNRIGAIGACVAGEQFKRSKFGDRFFYSHNNLPYPFTAEQMAEIRNMTFSKFTCTVSDVGKVPQSGFLAPSTVNPFVSCDRVGRLDLSSFAAKKI